jgi:hypothetical protein
MGLDSGLTFGDWIYAKPSTTSNLSLASFSQFNNNGEVRPLDICLMLGGCEFVDFHVSEVRILQLGLQRVENKNFFVVCALCRDCSRCNRRPGQNLVAQASKPIECGFLHDRFREFGHVFSFGCARGRAAL